MMALMLLAATETPPAIDGTMLAFLSLAGTGVLGLAQVIRMFAPGFAERRAARLAENTAESAEDSNRFSQNLELTKYINTSVTELVNAQLGDLRQELATTRESLETTKSAQDALERRDAVRTRAMTRILRAIAQQWPAGFPRPLIDPDDIEAIEELMPPQWLPSSSDRADATTD